MLLDRNLALLPYQQESRLMVILTTSHGSEVLRHLTPGSSQGGAGGASRAHGAMGHSVLGGHGFDAHEHFSLLDTASMANVLDAYEVFAPAASGLDSNGAAASASATLSPSAQAISQYLPNAMGIKQLLFLVDAARSRYGVVSRCAKVPSKYDAVADTEPGEILPDASTPGSTSGGSSSSSNIDENDSGSRTAGSGDVIRYLTVEQFGQVATEFGVEGGSVIAPESSLGFDATSLDL